MAPRVTAGVLRIAQKPYLIVLVVIYGLLALAAGRKLWSAIGTGIIPPLRIAQFGVFIFWTFIGLMAVLACIGYPRGARVKSRALARAGIVNSAGDAPILLAVWRDRDNPRTMVYEFAPADLPLSFWEAHVSEIEVALNICILSLRYREGKHRILIRCVSAEHDIPDYIEFAESVIPEQESELALGIGLTGAVTIDLSKTAHVLIAGNSGSGKTALLRCLLRQAVHKEYVVYIADFKGGIDYGRWWHNHATIALDEADVCELLKKLSAMLRQRLITLRAAGVSNIEQYNVNADTLMPRVIVAFDEIAEALDKTGADKHRKETIAELEQQLATISRLGRACGIHLFVGVQRPDVNAVPAQIKANLSYRCCSRADNVLSMIALDSTAAAEQIPKDSQGRFIDNLGRIYQSYFYKEEHE